MNEFALVEWGRAQRAIASAERLVESDPDSAVSRAYYAAFHAINALFALRGQSFTKHSALRAAIHRELIHSGQWPQELGGSFDLLMDLRERGDYGGLAQVSPASARIAVAKAGDILTAVQRSCPELGQTSS